MFIQPVLALFWPLIILVILGLPLMIAWAVGKAKMEAWIKGAGKPSSTTNRSMKKASVLSTSELVLFQQLQKLLSGNQVLAQVAFHRFLLPERDEQKREWLREMNMAADFLICGATSQPLAVIELDDRTHADPRRYDKDERRDALLTNAGIPVIRFSTRKKLTSSEILAALKLHVPTHSWPGASGL